MDKTATQFYPCETAPSLCGGGTIIRQHCRQALGDFFRAFLKDDPRWISLTHPVKDDQSTCLTYLLGLEHSVGIDFLCSAGFLKRGHSKYPNAISVVKAEWDAFVVEEGLGDVLEPVNISLVSGKRYPFINLGSRKNLRHTPNYQFNGKADMPKFGAYLGARQRKLCKSLSDMVLTLRVYDESHKVLASKEVSEEAEEYDSEDSMEEEDETTPPSEVVWKEKVVLINATKCPNMSKILPQQCPKSLINALFCEMLGVLGDGTCVNFVYRNDKKGCAVVVPQVTSQASLMEQARRLKWIDRILKHLAGGDCNEEDAAEWLSYYLGKKYDGAFTLASEALGIPLVQRMDATNAAAMWSDANVNITQQRILKKHLKVHFGKRLFIPENKIFNSDLERYSAPTSYGEYKFYKDGDRTQKPEKCPFWTRDASLVVLNELTRVLEYSDSDLISSNCSSILSVTNGCNLVAGADQGQGAWRSWIKISIMSAEDVRERMARDENFDAKKSYSTAQTAHITCKKDHPEILAKTVSEELSIGYEKLATSSLVFIYTPLRPYKIKGVYLSRHSQQIKLEKDLDTAEDLALTYVVAAAGDSNGFSLHQTYEERFPRNSKIVLTIPCFNLFITGDLSFYADVLGMPNSSSYWCPWCLLSRPEWQESADATGESRTTAFLEQMGAAITTDVAKRLKPMDKKGVSGPMHYKCLGPEHFVPPLLHLEMGMVNNVWDDFEQWVDDKVEIIPPHEKEARLSLERAQQALASSTAEKEEGDRTLNIEIREKNAEAKLLKTELRRKTLPDDRRQELHLRLRLIENAVGDHKEQLKVLKENIKKCQQSTASCKKLLETYRIERGKPEASIVSEIEMFLETFKVSRAAYHGGDFNGVSCRRLVANAHPISDELRQILIRKKNEACEDTTIHKKMEDLESIMGLLDATFAYLNVSHPTQEEKTKAEEAVNTLSRHWRKMGLRMTLKAHVVEKHVNDFNMKWGLGDKEESFVEQGHQIGLRDNRRYAGLTNFIKRTESTMKERCNATHPLVQQQQMFVLQQTKRRKSNQLDDFNPNKRSKSEEINHEKHIKREYYVKNKKEKE